MDVPLLLLGLFFCTVPASLAQTTARQFTSASEECGDRPADVVFVLDSSSSIKADDFRKQLQFVKGVVEFFDIGPNKTQVGAVSFSNWAFLDFHLAAYDSQSEIQEALSSIQQIKGDTNTAHALSYARDVMFQPHNGARPHLPHIVIVLTDGKSNIPTRTAQEAKAAHAHGMHVFAIGIGREVEPAELLAIASSPREQFVFQVGDYTALQYIREILAIKTCEVSEPTTPAPTEKMQVDQACGDAALADIVFAPAPAGSAENTEKALAFFREVASGFDIDNEKVRVGLVPKDCNSLSEVALDSFDDKSEVMAQLDLMVDSIPATASQLKYMRRVSFRAKNGARTKAKRLAVMLVDAADDLDRAKYEASKLKLRNVQLFVIGVGKAVAEKKLQSIASQPPSQHVFSVASYDELPRLIYRVKSAMCPEPSSS